MRTALTIAGSDSGGGAGIQADLKTFAACNVYGTSALTAITAQNTRGVAGVHILPAEFVTLQIETVVSDLGCDSVKTGMLASAPIVEAVAACIESLELPNLVVDPVMVAKGGEVLLDQDAVHAVRVSLIRLARVITPNVPEAEALTGMTIASVAEMREAATRLRTLGAAAVVVKGGHLAGPESVDVLADATQVVELRTPRIAGPHTHGTGCTFAAALAAHLALGASVDAAARSAKDFVTGAMRAGIPLGGGHRPVNHFFATRPR